MLVEQSSSRTSLLTKEKSPCTSASCPLSAFLPGPSSPCHFSRLWGCLLSWMARTSSQLWLNARGGIHGFSAGEGAVRVVG